MQINQQGAVLLVKGKAKQNYIRTLRKVCAEENLALNLDFLSDEQVKDYYLKLQTLRSGTFSYAIGKNQDFVEAMKAGELQRVSFRDTFKYGVRKLTFKEFLLFCDFLESNPTTYPAYNRY